MLEDFRANVLKEEVCGSNNHNAKISLDNLIQLRNNCVFLRFV